MTEDVTKWAGTINRAVSRYARGASKEQKEDLVQECYLWLLEMETVIEAADSPVDFVYIACANKIIDIFRSERSLNNQAPLEEADEVRVPAENRFGVSKSDLNRAIEKLTDTQAYVVRCRYFLGQSEEEVAAAMGQTRWVVRRVYKNAIQRLREILGAKCQ